MAHEYVALAVEAWQQEQLSEEQLARFLRTDRLGARERIQLLEVTLFEDSDQGELVNLAMPFLRSAGR